MNMIPGTVRAAAGQLEVALDGGVVLPLPAGARASDGQAVLYGIRPEHCAQADGGGVPVDVVVVEPTGADTQLYCRFNGREITATIRDRTDCRPNDRIHLVPDLVRAHLFDAASGVQLAARV